MLAHLQNTNPEDWEFCILVELPSATDQDLVDYEERAIAKLSKKAPEKVLNIMANVNVPRQDLGSSAPKSTITHNNIPISYTAAAKMLGCSMKQLQKRLRRYRLKDVMVVELEVLMELSERYTGRASDEEVDRAAM